jgi:serine/threonine-protein kinase
MLLDEARIASRLSHRHIAQVLDVGKEGDQYFIAMEFVDGPALRRLLAWAGRTNQHVPIPIALAVADTMLSALDYAHALTDEKGQPLNIVHRDVTPQNVLLTLRGEVKLVDFGLARASTRQFRTETGVVRGTLPYMSPEQAQQGPIDLRTDVYAAGATLYELFTSVRAFPAGPSGELPAPPSTLRPNLSPKLDAVLLKAVAAEAPSRWASAGQLRAALLDALLPERPASDSETANWLQRVLVELPEAPAPGAPKVPSTADDRTATRKVEPPKVAG